MNPQAQPQNNLDPSVVALTKAIGQQESGGNYNAPQGKNGETGAYQMTPGFIQNYAPKFIQGYQPGQQLNPAQQDELAYNVVKEWGTNGDPLYPHLGKLNPAQIASAWNAGDPNAYLDEEMKGVNAAGASYNVPEYVNKIQQNYDKNMGIDSTPQAQTQTGTPIGDQAINLMRSAPKTGNISDIGPEISSGVTQTLAGGVQGLVDIGNQLGNFGRGLFGQAPQPNPQIVSPQSLQPKNTGEMLGNVLGGILAATPLAFTGGGATTAEKALTYVPTAEATPAEATALKALSTPATEATPSALSKIVNLGKTALGITGAEDIARNIGNALLNRGGGQTQSSADTSGTASGGQAPASNELASTVSPDLGRSAAATAAIADAIKNILNTTQPGRVFTSSKEGQNAIDTAAMFGLISLDENGNLTFDEGRRQQALKEVANLDDKIIASEGGSASPLSALNYAGQYIGNDKFTTPLDRQQAAEWAQREVSARGIPTNGQMSLSDMREAQKEHYAAAKGGYGRGKTSAEILAHKALAYGYGQAIRAKLSDPELHDRALAMEQALIRSKALEKKIQGKRAPVANGRWEHLLRQGARAAEIYIGDKIGGPVGAIIGGLAGESLNRKITRHFGRNIFETKGMKAAMDVLHETKPKEYTELVKALKQKGISFTPEQEAENQTMQQKVKDVAGDVGEIGAKKLAKEFRQEEKKTGLVKAPKKKGLVKPKK